MNRFRRAISFFQSKPFSAAAGGPSKDLSIRQALVERSKQRRAMLDSELGTTAASAATAADAAAQRLERSDSGGAKRTAALSGSGLYFLMDGIRWEVSQDHISTCLVSCVLSDVSCVVSNFVFCLD